jgi:hypothetical protein
VLCVESLGSAGGEIGVEQAVDGMKVCYSLESERGVETLDEVQWADWSHEGKLLAATRSGRLRVSSPGESGLEILFEEDLSVLEPSPIPAPDWAGRW